MPDAATPITTLAPHQGSSFSPQFPLVALFLGIALTLAFRGYQFGGGNHTVYLIEPLRQVHPGLLKNDWWATHTFQYHIVFTKLSATLMRAGIIEPAFLALYLLLVVLLHLGWLKLTTDLGLTARHYLLSVILYHLNAGGAGLGMYQFLQDSAFLPGNVANIAMLWGLREWIAARRPRSAIWFALAALFHLNHALVAIAMWIILGCREIVQQTTFPNRNSPGLSAIRRGARRLPGLALILVASLPNIIPAAQMAFSAVPRLPIDEFVNLYVRLRHPHHYDPLSWPPALWISFLWPIPLAAVAMLRLTAKQHEKNRRSNLADQSSSILHPQSSILAPPCNPSRAAGVFLFFTLSILFAFVFAGIRYVFEPLIQMSLFRFSIYPKLLACIGAAAFLLDLEWRAVRRWVWLIAATAAMAGVAGMLVKGSGSAARGFVRDNLGALTLITVVTVATLLSMVLVLPPRQKRAGQVRRLKGMTPHRQAPASASALLVLMVLLVGWRMGWLGLRLNIADNSNNDYLALCRWVRENTPVDAVFVVPPNEQLFRHRAQRAIVVNFKCTPQLSSEMAQWTSRLQDVLDMPLEHLPRRFDLAHAAIAKRYDELPPEYLRGIAGKYDARYVVTSRCLPGIEPIFENTSCRLYDLQSAWTHRP